MINFQFYINNNENMQIGKMPKYINDTYFII